MLEVAAFSLVDRHLLDVDDGNLKAVTHYDHKLATDPLERAILTSFKRKLGASMYPREFRAASDAIEARPAQTASSQFRSEEMRSGNWESWHVLGGVAAIKVIIAWKEGHNVWFLISAWRVALSPQGELPPLTKSGEPMLADLRTLMRRY